MEGGAREWAVEDVFGIEPELLNDDRLGRALDAIAPHLQEITDSVGVIARTRLVTGCLRTSVTTDVAGRPALHWHFDQAVIDAEAAVDGWYALLTTLTPEQADAAEVLRSQGPGRGRAPLRRLQRNPTTWARRAAFIAASLKGHPDINLWNPSVDIIEPSVEPVYQRGYHLFRELYPATASLVYAAAAPLPQA
ncbi:hypothetical protein [Streptomyces sp. NPDC051286]|uniref:hypothetical protein n=1 Tax=Streptomyces sp. NPDC051286 TaxID=3365647 RepID=UPI0037B5F6C9